MKLFLKRIFSLFEAQLRFMCFVNKDSANLDDFSSLA